MSSSSLIKAPHHAVRTMLVKALSLALPFILVTCDPGTCDAQKKITSGLIVRELPLHKEINTITLDHDGFLWAGTNSGLYRFDGYEFVLLEPEMSGLELSGTESIKYLLEDNLGHLWISAQSGLYVLSRDRQEKIELTFPGNNSGDKLNVVNIVQVKNEIWLFSSTSVIECFRLEGNRKIIHSRTINTPSYNTVNVMQLEDGRYLAELPLREAYIIISEDGLSIEKKESPAENAVFINDTITHTLYALGPPLLYTFDRQQQAFIEKVSFQSTILRAMPCWATHSLKSPGSLWIGSKLGHVIWYSPSSTSYVDITQTLNDRLFEGRFFTTTTGLEDKNGGFWLGTSLGLVYIKLVELQYFTPLSEPQTLVSRQSFSTRGIARDRNGDLFVSSYAGLFRYHKGKPAKEYMIWNNVLQENVDPVVYTFLPEKDHILMASEGNGLLRYDYVTDSIYRIFPASYFDQADNPAIKALQWCFEIEKDHAGVIWLGMNAGLFTLEGDEQLRPSTTKGAGRELGRIYEILEDTNHTLWLGTAKGLYSIGAERQTLTSHPIASLENTPVQCVVPDHSDWLWIGTRGRGLIHYQSSTGNTIHYTTEQGLADNIVCGILSGDDGALWISTNQGLSRFDPFQNQFVNFYLEDGLPDNEFNHGSSMKDADGTLYFGGVNGVVTFHPKRSNFKRNVTHLRVTRINVHDGAAGNTVTQLYNNYHHPEINLGFRDKYFTVYFGSNEPVPFSRENFAYRLSGLDNTWQVIGQQNSIQFTGLQPGHYTLQVKALHQPGSDPNILEIPVFVARPFFKQWYAYLFYLFAIGGIAFLILREYFKRLHIHRQLQLEIDHKARLQEINRSKSTFFTNITHEFKTPLTLIHGPAEEIARISKDPQVTKQAGLISKSAKSILALVNQLLDLGKLEANLEEPQFHRLDLVKHVQGWMEKFVPLARQKEIKLGFETEQTAMYVDFDPVKFETVINNLLSNAIKFTPEKGAVKCSIKSTDLKTVQITIQDNGPGIPKEEQDLIFDRFYQGKNSVLGGTGIGLAFVREMVRIHGGSVSLISSAGEGAAFTVTIPFYQQDALGDTSSTQNSNEGLADFPEDLDSVLPSGKTEKPVILVVEDHDDVAELILDVIRKEYQVFHAPNGRDGHRIAMEQVPDLILTDVMMPVMDGYSFTHLVKHDVHTSHIPVIMLTAKDGEQARIEGRSSGADVYLQKPFSIRELQLTIRNMLNLKVRLAENVSKQLEKNAGEVAFATDADTTFYKSFLNILEHNLSESSLSVDDFTTQLGTSRTQLHRKLKAITGLSVNQIVRNVRLQKGMALIREGKKTIAEVAYEVGFSNPAYFTERFKEYYGYPPSETDRNTMPGPSA